MGRAGRAGGNNKLETRARTPLTFFLFFYTYVSFLLDGALGRGRRCALRRGEVLCCAVLCCILAEGKGSMSAGLEPINNSIYFSLFFWWGSPCHLRVWKRGGGGGGRISSVESVDDYTFCSLVVV